MAITRRILVTLSDDTLQFVEDLAREYNLPMGSTITMLVSKQIKAEKQLKEFTDKLPDVMKAAIKHIDKPTN